MLLDSSFDEIGMRVGWLECTSKLLGLALMFAVSKSREPRKGPELGKGFIQLASRDRGDCTRANVDKVKMEGCVHGDDGSPSHHFASNVQAA